MNDLQEHVAVFWADSEIDFEEHNLMVLPETSGMCQYNSLQNTVIQVVSFFPVFS